MKTQSPIAVFDSGLGGLTVVGELRRRLPNEDIVYFGDTARVPYGTKSAEAVMRFTRQTCSFLLRMEPKCIVAACNTSSAVCLPQLAAELPVPLFGVVEPGARAAVEAAEEDGLIAVLATEATVDSNAYRKALAARAPRRAVVQLACPLFVPMVEEGLDPAGPIVQLVIQRYLGPLKRLAPSVVVLGCTHYPMLGEALSGFFGASVLVIDSASATAHTVESKLRLAGALSTSTETGRLHCYVSDNPRRLQSVGSRFLGESIPDVLRVCPEELEFVGSGPPLRTSPRVSA